jgi:hypothetical protein
MFSKMKHKKAGKGQPVVFNSASIKGGGGGHTTRDSAKGNAYRDSAIR